MYALSNKRYYRKKKFYQLSLYIIFKLESQGKKNLKDKEINFEDFLFGIKTSCVMEEIKGSPNQESKNRNKLH